MSDPVRTRPHLTEQILALAVIVLLLSLAGQISAVPTDRTDDPTPPPAGAELNNIERLPAEADAALVLAFPALWMQIYAPRWHIGEYNLSRHCLWGRWTWSRGPDGRGSARPTIVDG